MLVTMTVLLCIAWRRRCIVRTAVATVLRRNAAIRIAAVTTGTVANTSAQSTTSDAAHTGQVAGESKSKASIVAETVTGSQLTDIPRPGSCSSAVLVVCDTGSTRLARTRRCSLFLDIEQERSGAASSWTGA